jgi:glycosyltransferase involved in cell wall biosynthesis
VIPNGIDLAAYSCPGFHEFGVALRQDIGVAAEERLVLMPAVMRPEKGHELLIAAVPRIRARMPNARIAFAGAGERESELRDLARQHGDAILFLGHRRDMPQLFAASDLVVLPSMAEGLPTVLIEAAAAGRPVVATRVGGVSEVVEHGRTGLLVPPSEPEALAEAIAKVLLDEDMARRFGQDAKELARERFSLALHAQHTVNLWSEVLANAR